MKTDFHPRQFNRENLSFALANIMAFRFRSLLTILGITKQSLARVLRDLVESGFIEQRTGAEDRRQRLLYLTAQGTALAQELLAMQNARMQRALGTMDMSQQAVIEGFLLGLVEKDDRPTIARLVRQGTSGGQG